MLRSPRSCGCMARRRTFDNIDEVSDVWRCCAPVIRESRQNALPDSTAGALWRRAPRRGESARQKKYERITLLCGYPASRARARELRHSLREAANIMVAAKETKMALNPPFRHLDGGPTKACHVDRRVRLLRLGGAGQSTAQHLVELSRKVNSSSVQAVRTSCISSSGGHDSRQRGWQRHRTRACHSRDPRGKKIARPSLSRSSMAYSSTTRIDLVTG